MISPLLWLKWWLSQIDNLSFVAKAGVFIGNVNHLGKLLHLHPRSAPRVSRNPHCWFLRRDTRHVVCMFVWSYFSFNIVGGR